MKVTNWTYAGKSTTPSIDELKQVASSVVRTLLDNQSKGVTGSSSGGFTAEEDYDDGVALIKLSFVLDYATSKYK